MEPPQKPDPGECCGSGCPVCVFDLYVEELRRYRVWLREQDCPSDDRAKQAPVE